MAARWMVLLGIALALAWATPVPADVIPDPGPSPTVTNQPSSSGSSNSGGYYSGGAGAGFPNNLTAAMPTRRNACGAIGAASLSILLTVAGCWVVRHRHRR